MMSNTSSDPRGARKPGYGLAWIGWGAGAAFLVLGIRLTLDPDPWTIDCAVANVMASLDHPAVRTVVAAFCWPAEGSYRPVVFSLLLTAGLLLLRQYKWGVIFGLAWSLAGITSVAVKSLVARPRPDTADMHLLATAYTESFPSGHVSLYGAMFLVLGLMAYYGVVSRTRRRLLCTACMLGLVVTALARLYLQVHWLSDVLGGALLALWATGIIAGLVLCAWSD